MENPEPSVNQELFVNPDPPVVPAREGECDCDNLVRRLKELERCHDAVARYVTDFVAATNATLYDLINRVETLERNCHR